MAEKNPTTRGADSEPSTTERQELQDQALILRCLLVHWPIHLQATDLLREMNLDAGAFGDRDRVDRALDQLFWAGLVIRCGTAVVPTRAAFQYALLGAQTPSNL
jgi:hypothetical protein